MDALTSFKAAIRKVPPFAIILVVGLVSWFCVDPVGDFPLNDDWSYTSAVRHLLFDGRLILSDWGSPLALTHYLAGFVVVKLFGFSHTWLRFGTLLWGVVGAWVFHRLLILEELAPALRWLATGLYFFNPITFVLMFSFHTDVPFLTLMTATLYFYLRAERSDRARNEWIASVLALLAAATRQIGLGLPVGATLWLIVSRRARGPRVVLSSLARAWLVPLVGMALTYAWFLKIHGPTVAHVNYVTRATIDYLSSPLAFVGGTLGRTLEALLYLSLFGLPLVLLWPASEARLSPKLTAVAAALGVALAWLARSWLPGISSVLHSKGLGAVTVLDSELRSPFLWGARATAAACQVAAAAGLGVLVLRVAANARTVLAGPNFKAVLMVLPVAAATLVGAVFVDRYLLSWFLGFLLLLVALCRGARVPAVAWIMLSVSVLACVAGTGDYFEWNRAKWELGLAAGVKTGIAPESVSNGFDWNAHWRYESSIAKLKSTKPLSQIGEWEWQGLEPYRAVVSYSPNLFPPDRQLLKTTYYSVLAPSGETLYLYRLR